MYSDGPAPESIGKTSDTPTENIETGTAENQAIIITPAELKEALQPLADQVAEVAQQVAQLTEAAQQTEEVKPAETVEPEQQITTPEQAIEAVQAVMTETVEQAKAAVEEVTAAAMEEVKILVEGIPTQVQEAIEAAKAPVAEEPVPAPIAAGEPLVTIEAVEQKVTEQISVALEQHEAKIAEEAKSPTEQTEISQVVSHLAPLIKSNSSSFVLAFLTIICAVGMIISSGLYMKEQAVSAEIASEAAKSAADDAEKMRLMAQDVVHIHLLKNDNMEQAIQNKMDFLKSQKLPNGESMPDYKAIPMAYLDPEVIKEVAYCLPDSVRKLPYAEELVLIELKRVASYAEKELSKEQHKK